MENVTASLLKGVYLCSRLKELVTLDKELRRTLLLIIIVTRYTENRKSTVL